MLSSQRNKEITQHLKSSKSNALKDVNALGRRALELQDQNKSQNSGTHRKSTRSWVVSASMFQSRKRLLFGSESGRGRGVRGRQRSESVLFEQISVRRKGHSLGRRYLVLRDSLTTSWNSPQSVFPHGVKNNGITCWREDAPVQLNCPRNTKQENTAYGKKYIDTISLVSNYGCTIDLNVIKIAQSTTCVKIHIVEFQRYSTDLTQPICLVQILFKFTS